MDKTELKKLLDPEMSKLGMKFTDKNDKTVVYRSGAGEVEVTQLGSGNWVANSKNPALRKRVKDLITPTKNAVNQEIAPAEEETATEQVVDKVVESTSEQQAPTKRRGRPPKAKEETAPAEQSTDEKEPESPAVEPEQEIAKEPAVESIADATEPDETPTEVKELPVVNKHRAAVDKILDAAGVTNDVELLEDTAESIKFRIADVTVLIEGDEVHCDHELVKHRVLQAIQPATKKQEAKKQTPEPVQETEDKPQPVKPQATKTETEVKTTNGTNIFDVLIQRYGPDLFEVFGDTGTLKSKGLVSLALQVVKSGRKVCYFDTENNLMPPEKEALKQAGVYYRYTPVLKEIDEFMKNLPNMDFKLVIIDSVGMPVLRKFSSMGVKDRGEALLDIISWLGILKEYSYNHNALAFCSNQPQSEFGKSNPSEKGDNLWPFGDKSNFIPGHLLRSKKDVDGKDKSSGGWYAFRSRTHPKMEKVFTVEVTGSGSVLRLG